MMKFGSVGLIPLTLIFLFLAIHSSADDGTSTARGSEINNRLQSTTYSKMRSRRRRRDVFSQKGLLEHDLSSSDLSKTFKHNLPKQEATKLLYDSELRHLYGKLNGHFLKNNLQIARLDVVQLPSKYNILQPEAIVFHTTTTTTTSTTTTTTTTPAPEPETESPTEKQIDYEEPEEPFKNPPIGRMVKIVGEVEVNEDKLMEPISVQLDGEKIRAQLDIVPVKPVFDQYGNVLHFTHAHPLLKPDKNNHNWHFGVHNHTHDPKKTRPMHMRQFILKKQLGKSPNPPNIVAQMVNDGAHTIQDIGHLILPGVFHGSKPDKLPKVHKFHTVESESPHYLQHRNYHSEGGEIIEQVFKNKIKEFSKSKKFRNKNPKQFGNMDSVERGFVEIHDTDKEFPRLKESDYYHGEPY